MPRTLVIGDVHGCLIELEELLSEVQYSPGKDKLVFLGDLVDRGPKPIETLRYVINLHREKNVFCVRGNHDNNLYDWRLKEALHKLTGRPNNSKVAGLRKTQWSELSEEEVLWIKALPTHIHLWNDLWAIHAGFEPNNDVDLQVEDHMMHMRYVNDKGEYIPLNDDLTKPKDTVYWTEKWRYPRSVIYGHHVHSFDVPKIETFVDNLGTKRYLFGIDTGCCYGGKLTCLIFSNNQVNKYDIAQVKAKEAYYELPAAFKS